MNDGRNATTGPNVTVSPKIVTVEFRHNRDNQAVCDGMTAECLYRFIYTGAHTRACTRIWKVLGAILPSAVTNPLVKRIQPSLLPSLLRTVPSCRHECDCEAKGS